jgi:hypothetical protein
MAKANMHGSSEKEGKAWGHGQHSNMPKDVRLDTYPKAHQEGATVEDDTMTRIDAENKRAETKTRRFMSNQH